MAEPTTSGQQTTPTAAPVQPENNSTDWEARYKGLVHKVEELTLANRDLTDQLAGKSSQIEQLNGQLGVKDAEKAASLTEHQKQLQSIADEKTSLQSKLGELQSLALKVKVIKDLKRPELLQIADNIPNMTDEEALKAVFQNLAGFTDDMVSKREKEILAGVTPNVSSAGNQQIAQKPTSVEEWQNHINSLDLGSKERQKAMDDYWVWLNDKHKKE